MSTRTPPSPQSLPPSLEQRLDGACDRFEAAWRTGQRPRIEEYLADVPEPECHPLLHELLALEIELRSVSGDKPSLEEYGRRFPEHVEVLQAIFGQKVSKKDTAPPPGDGAPAVHPDLAEAERLYQNDLPELLHSKPGRWVVYTPQGCIAEGQDELALFRQCFRQGLERGRFLVARVEPDLPVAEMTENWLPPAE